MKRYYTYAYLREDKTPYYIGKGTGKRRFQNDNRVGCSTPKDKSRILVLKWFEHETDAYKHEIYMIAVLGRKDLGTGMLRNLSPGGEGGREPGFKLSPETCAKLSAIRRGIPKSAEHKRKISEAHKGKHPSAKTRARMSASAKKKRLSPEHKAKIGLARKGKPWSQSRRDAYNKSKEE
jgi:hypothetical protein